MPADPPALDASHWQRFIGRWDTRATHPLLPGAVILGWVTFDWVDGQRFLIQRSHYDHPDIPDAIAITGATGAAASGWLSMHYFDSRGVFRVYSARLDGDEWQFWRDDPGFRQRFTGTFSTDGNTITGQGAMLLDDGAWQEDLAITYQRSSADSDDVPG